MVKESKVGIPCVSQDYSDGVTRVAIPIVPKNKSWHTPKCISSTPIATTTGVDKFIWPISS